MLNSIEQLLFFQRLPSVGTATYWKVLDYLPGLHVLFKSSAYTLRTLLPPEAVEAIMDFRVQGENNAVMKKVRQDLEWLEQNNAQVIDASSEFYPELLRETKKAPPLLYVLGDVTCLSFPQIAVVGTRNPTPGGKSAALDFSAELARSGFTITSGLALGIDTAAHTGAVSVNGRSIAVLGTGVDRIYPNRNRELVEKILSSGGAIVSEFPIGTEPLPQNFPQRNRIISGLSYGTFVVEAAVKSGSLITARYAVQQNREVFALPGSIHNPLTKGCHRLIKEGAKLVDTAKDITEELKGFLSMSWEQLDLASEVTRVQIANELVTTESEEILLENLGFEATTVDTLVERTKLPVGDVMSCLLTMELKGLVANSGSGYIRLSTANDHIRHA